MEGTPRVTTLTTADELEAAFALSSTRLVLFFKHSATCGRSAMAAEEVVDWLDATKLYADVYVLDVRRHRALCRVVAERLNVRHESPQVLLVRNGRACWHASHAGVAARAIERAIKAATHEGSMPALGGRSGNRRLANGDHRER